MNKTIKKTNKAEQGFTYLSLLFIIVLMGLAASVTGQVWSKTAQRDKEVELLFRGSEVRRAIGNYYQSSPGAKSYPKSLDDLLQDARYPVTKRYLRRIYEDPFTGKADWVVLKAPGGGVMGIKSRSTKRTIKKANFPMELIGFEDKTTYNGWAFSYIPPKTAVVR
jgi:type II secretory pathway pseudopilin PulG